MGIIWTFDHAGEDGGTWYAASYPLGATRYYSTRDARTAAVAKFQAAVRATGGNVAAVECARNQV